MLAQNEENFDSNDFAESKNNLNGSYFLYENTNEDKKLQVFSQSVKIGQANFVMTTIRDMSHWLEIEHQK